MSGEALPVADVGAITRRYRDEIDVAVRRVLDSGWFVMGPEVGAFEREFAAAAGASHAVAVANGTDAVELALRAAGVGPGDVVVTVSHTATATVAAVERAGAVPYLVDVDPDRFTLAPEALEEALDQLDRHPPAGSSGRVGAVVVVHLYGMPADMDALGAVAGRVGVPVVEDCAQAHGAMLGGRPVGSFGVAGAFSFYPTKNLGALGDAGAVVTNSTVVAERVRQLRQYGWVTPQVSERPGANSRMDELQAAVLRARLPHLADENRHRRGLAAAYDSALAPPVRRPPSPADVPGAEPVYHQYVVRIPADARPGVRDRLADAGIGTALHYPMAVHRQPAYEGRVPCGPLPVTEGIAGSILSLPIGLHVEPGDATRVAGALAGALDGTGPAA